MCDLTMADKDNANIKDNAENMMDEDNVHEDNAETMAKDAKGEIEKERRLIVTNKLIK